MTFRLVPKGVQGSGIVEDGDLQVLEGDVGSGELGMKFLKGQARPVHGELVRVKMMSSKVWFLIPR